VGLRRNLGGKLISGQASAREDWELLSANEGVQTVDGRDAGLDELAWMSPQHWIDGRSVNIERVFWNDEAAIERPADGIETGLTCRAKHQPDHVAGGDPRAGQSSRVPQGDLHHGDRTFNLSTRPNLMSPCGSMISTTHLALGCSLDKQQRTI
jgi:hypothetical protein